ncbi:MAG: hypothetical protein AAF320_04835 [Myxococcota bacterium]
MNTHWAGIVVGGLLPALLYGVAGVLMKASTQQGIGLGIYMLCAGAGVMSVGGAHLWFFSDKTMGIQSACYALSMGIAWGLGTLLVTIGLTRFAVPVSKLVPLYNMNTLVAVLLGLWIFAEWQQIRPLQLAVGTLFIVVGGTLVANA